ncbi:hypothetical protein MKZ38_005970 [Zalerion maritima]|uniref:RGP1 n=1 Tax=Zalerion maritima TaxID=339359 RepID=A0AAD5WUN4_9PEZI|nr:hypothetical protein MKZ38_005970 [Zalerion maritima]
MSPSGSGNIRVFVQWTDQTVFAGEEIKCRITFKNIAPDSNNPTNHAVVSKNNSAISAAGAGTRPTPNSDRPTRQLSPLHPSAAARGKQHTPGLTPPASTATVRGHRSTLSLNVPHTTPNSPLRNGGSVPWSPQNNALDRSSRRGSSHKRSISIVSIASNNTVDDRSTIPNGSPIKPTRNSRGHGRSASLQILPRGSQVGGGPHSATLPLRQPHPLNSPQHNASYLPDRYSHSKRSSRASTAPSTPAVARQPSPRGPPPTIPEFRFPAAPPSDTSANHGGNDQLSPLYGPEDYPPPPPSKQQRDNSQIPTISEHIVPPATRVLAAQSIGGGTPRSSGEFYTISNNSSETLASEYPPQPLPARGMPGRPPHIRRPSNLSPLGQQRQPESLMMGYAQVQGAFTLDGSLIHLGPFEQVKRKAVVGGQGGGVVGVETSKQNSGLLRGFGWGNLLNDLVGGNELSTIKEMRGVASAKSIPLLSTPQSILFVDIKLAPGESKAFDYSFRLPKGLPPSHRGKAMKITYTLVLGTQRSGGAREQQVRTVEIPFRVLGSVNVHGEILGHDLMCPYVILRDQANVQAVDKHASSHLWLPGGGAAAKEVSPPSTLNGFLSYVGDLLGQSRDAPGLGLLSPSDVAHGSRRLSAFEAAVTSAKEAIDLAILRSNMTEGGGQSQNRFEIARNGLRVGVVMLTRPAYRLGEAITMAIDFSQAEIPCYAVHAALETTEKVDHSLALRSEASIHRVTRKVYVSSSETTLYSRRIVFTPTIPINATPEFVTSGVSLEWKVRLEFVVPAHEADQQLGFSTLSPHGNVQDAGDGGGGGGSNDRSRSHTPVLPAAAAPAHHLLEEISRDDRGGLIVVAAENLICESFEVAVPLRVYGTVCKGLEKLERDEALEEGLVI